MSDYTFTSAREDLGFKDRGSDQPDRVGWYWNPVRFLRAPSSDRRLSPLESATLVANSAYSLILSGAVVVGIVEGIKYLTR